VSAEPTLSVAVTVIVTEPVVVGRPVMVSSLLPEAIRSPAGRVPDLMW
jgi:hypothetical protein